VNVSRGERHQHCPPLRTRALPLLLREERDV
jgi:hypothetical protein